MVETTISSLIGYWYGLLVFQPYFQSTTNRIPILRIMVKINSLLMTTRNKLHASLFRSCIYQRQPTGYPTFDCLLRPRTITRILVPQDFNWTIRGFINQLVIRNFKILTIQLFGD